MKTLHKLWQIFLDILFPPLCLSCKCYLRSANSVLCEKCCLAIPISTAFVCGGCNKRIPTRRGQISACRCRENCIIGSASIYAKGPIHELITALKYRGVTQAAEPLGKLMAKFILETKCELSDFIIIPMPLSSVRIRERGYNQAELIAKEFLESLPNSALKLRTDIIKRVRNSNPQTSVRSRELRRENVTGAFSVVKPSAVRGRRVLLIDDVFTSGGTAREAIKELKAASVRQVVVLTAARA